MENTGEHQTGNSEQNVVKVDFKNRQKQQPFTSREEFDELIETESKRQRDEKQIGKQHKHLTRRQKLTRRLLGPLVAIGIIAGTAAHVANQEEKVVSSETGFSNRSFIEQIENTGHEIIGIIPEATISKNARLRNKPSTKNSQYTTLGVVDELNGVSIERTTAIEGENLIVIEGDSASGFGKDPWIVTSADLGLGGNKIYYINDSNLTKEILDTHNEELLKTYKSPEGTYYAKDAQGNKIPETEFNKITPVKK